MFTAVSYSGIQEASSWGSDRVGCAATSSCRVIGVLEARPCRGGQSRTPNHAETPCFPVKNKGDILN